MTLSRNITHIFRFILDELIPPVLRDSKIFMWPLFYLLFRNKTKYFMEFKKLAHQIDNSQIAEIYKITHDVHINRETDTNSKCIEKIQEDIIGNTVLDAGCGNGFMTRLIEDKFDLTALDIHKYEDFKSNSITTKFVNGSVESLPFDDEMYDNVICSHTIEHVVNFELAISQLQRVAKKNLIIILPMQREYKYTFDLHLHFFPNPDSFLLRVPKKNGWTRTIDVIGGDLYYREIKK